MCNVSNRSTITEFYTGYFTTFSPFPLIKTTSTLSEIFTNDNFIDLWKTKHDLLTNFHFKLFHNTNFSSCFVCHVESITGSTLHLIHTGCISAFNILQRFVFLLCSHLLPFKLFFLLNEVFLWMRVCEYA